MKIPDLYAHNASQRIIQNVIQLQMFAKLGRWGGVPSSDMIIWGLTAKKRLRSTALHLFPLFSLFLSLSLSVPLCLSPIICPLYLLLHSPTNSQTFPLSLSSSHIHLFPPPLSSLFLRPGLAVTLSPLIVSTLCDSLRVLSL